MIGWIVVTCYDVIHAAGKRPRVSVAVALGTSVWVAVLVGVWFTGSHVHFRLSPVIFRPNNVTFTKGTLNTQHQDHHGRSKHDGRWVTVSSREYFYIYSAFYDNRRSLASSLPVVRVIGIARTQSDDSVFCVVYYDTAGSNQEYKTKAVMKELGAGVPYSGLMLKEYLFTCSLLHNNAIPTRVAIIAYEQQKPRAFLPVEVAQLVDHRANFALCMSVAYWYHKPSHVIEWMEILRMFGVDLVVVYNNSLVDESARVFQFYDYSEGFVDFRQSHSSFMQKDERLIHGHMSPVINDCIYRNMYKFKKIVVTDMDELIIPRQHSSYGELIRSIDQIDPSNHPARSYIFSNNYFFLELPSVHSNSSKLDIITLNKQYKMPVSPVGYASKSIIDPLACVGMHNHFCWQYTPQYDNGDQVIFVDPELGLNHHYKHCHFDDVDNQPGKCKQLLETAVRDDSMERFRGEVTMRVQRQLQAYQQWKEDRGYT